MDNRGSLSKQGIVKDALEKLWRDVYYNIKPASDKIPSHIRTAQKERARYERIEERWERGRHKAIDRRKKKFTREYQEIKFLFAQGRYDEAIKRLKLASKRKW